MTRPPFRICRMEFPSYRRFVALISHMALLSTSGVFAQTSAENMSPQTPIQTPKAEIQTTIAQAKKAQDSGDVAKAISILEEAKIKAKTAKNPIGEGAAGLSLAQAYRLAGDDEKAKGALNQAADAYRSVNDFGDEAIAYMELGTVCEYRQKGAELRDAIDYYRIAAADFGKAKYYDEQGFALVQMGRMWQRRGRLLPAIDAYMIARNLGIKEGGRFRSNGYGHRETFGVAYAALGSAYASAGNYEFALYVLDLNTMLTGPTDDPLTFAAVDNEYAAIDNRLGYFEDTLKRTTTGLEGARIVGDRRLEAQLLARRAVAKLWLQDRSGLQDFSAAAKIGDELNDQHLRALMLLELASVERDPKQARTMAGESLHRLNSFPDSELFVEANALYGDKCVELNDLDDAVKAYEIAAGAAETVADEFPKLTDMRVNYYRKYLGIFNGLIEVYLRKNDLPNAYWWVQTKKARGIIDASSLKAGPLAQRLSDDEKKSLVETQEDVARYSRQVLAARLTDSKNQTAQWQLQTREMELAAYVDSLYSKHSEQAPAPKPLADLDYLPRVLPEDTALLEYASLNSDVSRRMVLLVVTIEKGQLNLKSYILHQKDGEPISTAECAKIARGYRTACTIPAASVKSSATDLYNLLIAQAEDQIRGKRRLIICPDGPLWEVPFQSLIDRDGKYLVENYEVDYEYSASTFTAAMNRKPLGKRPDSRTVLVIADPTYGTRQRFARDLAKDTNRKNGTDAGPWINPLEDTLVEAEKIKEVFPQAELLPQNEAQESAIRAKIGAYDYVHFATHAVVFDDEPFMSALVLAAPENGEKQDGFLTARELMDMNLKADMVVLSACNTGTGQRRGSEGIIGLGWALFVGGSPTQVLSQWQVSDKSTAQLMADFYGQLKMGQSKGSALRNATLRLLKDPKTRHPYYWAPFFLIGDYR